MPERQISYEENCISSVKRTVCYQFRCSKLNSGARLWRSRRYLRNSGSRARHAVGLIE